VARVGCTAPSSRPARRQPPLPVDPVQRFVDPLAEALARTPVGALRLFGPGSLSLASDLQQGDIGSSETWSVDGIQVGTGASLFQYRIPTQGTHTITLSATDGANLSSSASINLTIGPATGKPTVAITSPANGSGFNPTDQITFAATANAQGSATIPNTGYTWTDDIDGKLGTGRTIRHKLSGSIRDTIVHHVTVTATDTLGRSANDTVQDGGIC
jgi:hypothetical protein